MYDGRSSGTDSNQTPNAMRVILANPGSQSVGDKLHAQKGNSPDRQLRSLNSC